MVTVTAPPDAMADCRPALVVWPRSKVTLVSVLVITLSVAMVVLPTFKRATAPAASVPLMVALAVRLVLLAFRVLATTVPPTGVSVMALAVVVSLVTVIATAWAAAVFKPSLADTVML